LTVCVDKGRSTGSDALAAVPDCSAGTAAEVGGSVKQHAALADDALYPVVMGTSDALASVCGAVPLLVSAAVGTTTARPYRTPRADTGRSVPCTR
jgi:hypothetical protein